MFHYFHNILHVADALFARTRLSFGIVQTVNYRSVKEQYFRFFEETTIAFTDFLEKCHAIHDIKTCSCGISAQKVSGQSELNSTEFRP